ncbi:Ig-like domain-containing protein [Thermodesulfobacteriota bacterium]
MNCKNMNKILRIPFLAFLAVVLSAGISFGVELAVVEAEWTPPDGSPAVSMWAFISVTDAATYVCPGAPVAWDVGPVIRVTAGATLDINLKNCLSEAVSVFIPGQTKSTSPVFSAGRVTSFDEVVLPNATGSYTWTNVKAGTYLYQSGTFIAKQVPKGLYGALVVDVGAGEAYTGVNYSQDEVLVYSEIDPALNNAAAGAGVGARVNNYLPKYFLINGETYPNTGNINVTAGADVLLRFVNAGLQTYVPTLQGLYMNVFAEDGNLLPNPLNDYQVELTAAKTLDAVVTLSALSRHALYDRSLHIASSADNGGMLTFIQTSDITLPIAVGDNYSIAEGNVLNAVAGATPPAPVGVLDNDTGTGLTAHQTGTAPPGALILNTDGSFMYTPVGAAGAVETFQYYANDGTYNSSPATVTITVTTRPIAKNDAVTIPRDSAPVAITVLTNDEAVAGINLDSVALRSEFSARGNPLVVNPGGTITYTTDGGGGPDYFYYTFMDANGAVSNEATVRINRVRAIAAPAAAPNSFDRRGRTKSRR